MIRHLKLDDTAEIEKVIDQVLRGLLEREILEEEVFFHLDASFQNWDRNVQELILDTVAHKVMSLIPSEGEEPPVPTQERSTLTWWSMDKPPGIPFHRCLVACADVDGKMTVVPHVYYYSEIAGRWFAVGSRDVLERKDVVYWAYVPVELTLNEGKGKQSQVEGGAV